MMKRLAVLLAPLGIGLFAGAFRATWVEPGGDLAHMLGLGLPFAALSGVLSVACGLPAWC
jgi:hypothetical protein